MGASLSELIQECYITDEWMSDVTSSKFEFLMFTASWHNGPLTIKLYGDRSTEHNGLLTVYALSIKPSFQFTSVRSDRLPSCSLWRRRCSLAVALSYRSRRNLSLALSRFISIELHSEESFVTQKFQYVCKFEMQVYLHFCLSNLNFRIWPHVHTQTDIHTRLAMLSR